MRKQDVRKTRSKAIGLPERIRPWLFGRSFLNVAGRILRSKRQRRTPLSKRQVSFAKRCGVDLARPDVAQRKSHARLPPNRVRSQPIRTGSVKASQSETRQASSSMGTRELALVRFVQRVAARGVVVTLLVLLVLVIWGMLALAFHAVLPERFAYLTAAQLESIRSVLALLFASGVVSEYLRRLLSR
ncbi:hypothetical protein C7S18_21280 [Ahniella affigens]|uniref:Uncharacterized protein n=1 Tax=Ahniella affigens TaxID=2021234 RepID=A0A2P1PXJ0_9GAMM|nr:hypothetical protein [Ahniella affigens]AVP99550.1 hypothetical protein C7S18_21280 [Ahniella affigens]